MTTGGNRRPAASSWPDSLLAPLRALPDDGPLLIALSGGMDSVVLLHAAVHCLAERPGGLAALHINHQLQPNADDCEAFCRELCASLGVSCQVTRVTVPQGATGGRGGLEAAAREARYQVFEAALAEGGTLLMAHHQDDQAETVLFRLLRGSGPAGLAGMPRQRPLGRGRLVRPFLELSRQQLQGHAASTGYRWVEDPSNQDTGFDRNFLRHRVLPLLKQRWPTVLKRLQRSAEACDEGAQLAASLARLHHQQVASRDGGLRVAELARLTGPEQKNLLRWWIGQRGLPVPERQDWRASLAELTGAGEDRQPELVGQGFVLRRYRGTLYLVSSEQPLPQPCWLEPGRPTRWGDWCLTLEPVVAPSKQIPKIRLSTRQGGERLRPDPGGPSRALKTWLQEQAVPPWERARLPVLTELGEVVAVGDFWISPKYAGAAPERGWRIVVERYCD